MVGNVILEILEADMSEGIALLRLRTTLTKSPSCKKEEGYYVTPLQE